MIQADTILLATVTFLIYQPNFGRKLTVYSFLFIIFIYYFKATGTIPTPRAAHGADAVENN